MAVRDYMTASPDMRERAVRKTRIRIAQEQDTPKTLPGKN